MPSKLDKIQLEALINDLKLSPDVSKVTVRGSSVIIEHSNDNKAVTTIGRTMDKIFPDFQRWSDEVDSEIAKFVADPWVNKLIPFGFLGVAIYTGIRNGAVLAGESAFALGYVAFDLYWKFQQENVMRKIERGISDRQRSELEQSGD